MRLYWWLLCSDSCRVHPIAHNYNRPIFLIDSLLLVMSREMFFWKDIQKYVEKWIVINSLQFICGCNVKMYIKSNGWPSDFTFIESISVWMIWCPNFKVGRWLFFVLLLNTQPFLRFLPDPRCPSDFWAIDFRFFHTFRRRSISIKDLLRDAFIYVLAESVR